MQLETIAGHTFTTNRDAICECGIAWAWLKEFCRKEHINGNNFAHSSYLSNHEYSQIEARREREAAEDERAYAAVNAVASGR